MACWYELRLAEMMWCQYQYWFQGEPMHYVTGCAALTTLLPAGYSLKHIRLDTKLFCTAC